jgi:hypothetical protein
VLFLITKVLIIVNRIQIYRNPRKYKLIKKKINNKFKEENLLDPACTGACEEAKKSIQDLALPLYLLPIGQTKKYKNKR